tara:strand:- start:770 stop:913 length:144 start_codon:yes stop_codon:yes gene_type:complete
MYELKTITRADGTTYESAFWIAVEEAQEWTKKQEWMQKAIDQFGTSS